MLGRNNRPGPFEIRCVGDRIADDFIGCRIH
jgi:hypothetical protein